MNKVGIYFAYWTRDWSADYVHYIEKVSKLGFDVLELAAGCLVEMPKFKRDDIKKAAEDKGIELTYCIGLPGNKDIASENVQIRCDGIDFVKKILDAIYQMQGKIFGGINYSCWPGIPSADVVDKRPYLERSINSMKTIIKTAEDYGITYCVEIVNRFEQFLLNTAAEGVDFANEVGSPNIKLLLDAFHMNIEEDSFREAINTAGDKLGHFHIGECNRKVPGRGRIPWNEIMQGLNDINYKGRIVMEPFVKMGGEVGRDIKVWRDLSNGANENQLDLDAKWSLDFIRSEILKSNK
jgi:D-psicose/D-tagatose/L-ribulose 3-epimerase